MISRTTEWHWTVSTSIKRSYCIPPPPPSLPARDPFVHVLKARDPEQASVCCYPAENDLFSFSAVQEYLWKDGFIAKPHRAVETLWETFKTMVIHGKKWSASSLRVLRLRAVYKHLVTSRFNLLDWAEILFNVQLVIQFIKGLYLKLQKEYK